ncbi:histone-lysine N-methyltransferase set-1-like [Odontesthes bonariensis]|uniref:histone-lysine N-methyltransferase set-1-like n=1 Tax=Odontesthes bonariensis TaxID=219752 RepID=UPI003F583906
MMADDGCSLKNPSRRRVRMKPQHDAEKHIRLKTDKEGLRQVFVNSYKGRGVFASIPFSKGDFVLEYRGKLLTPDNPPVVETYSETEATYLFDFQWKGKSWCLDASLEDQSLGRLVNDQHKAPTCKMRTIQVDGMPHLCLFALRDIVPGEEITYNYGESDWPWRKQISTSPVAAPSTGDDTNSSLQLLVPAEHVQHLSSNVNTISTSPVAAPSTGDDSNSSLQLLVPAEHVQHLSSNVNTLVPVQMFT